MASILDTANQVGEALKQTDEFKALQESVDAVKADPATAELYKRMEKLQQNIMAAQQANQPIGDELQKEYQEINAAIEKNDLLKDMITKEQAVFNVLNDVQQVYTKPLNELYSSLKEEKYL